MKEKSKLDNKIDLYNCKRFKSRSNSKDNGKDN
jgi:hypothetical protein